ncbi:MAG: LysR family transcriptional regulator [Oligoflexia bacterium]|nr:LysR family transcriptional regulator [Oligoflexia bacterium]
MSDINQIEVFAAVVKAGSFTKAARQLKLPKSSVSRKVALLEDRLGVALIRRTTRKLHLTDVGSKYFQTCTRILAELAEAEANAKSTQESPTGLLRITAPVELGSALLEEVLQRYLKAYKDVQVDLLLTDRIVDLMEENVDVAVRAGHLADSTLIAKKIGGGEFQLFASAAYLKRAGSPAHPKDLVNHACLAFTGHSDSPEWELENGKTRLKIAVPDRVTSSNLSILASLAVRSVGIALLPTFVARQGVFADRLVRVLPEWSSGSEPFYVVYPAQRFVSPKLKAFLACVSEVTGKQRS